MNRDRESTVLRSAAPPEILPGLAGLAAQIDAALPQTQCARCGYPDCATYARAIAEDGVDCISIGALTKHVHAIDFSLKLGPPPAG